jgi:hypothetical protein
MDEIGRKYPVHQPVQYRFNTPVIVFLTVCTKNRKSILTNEPAHQLLLEAWNTADSWNVGRYPGSCAFILRSSHATRAIFDAMGELLEIVRRSMLAMRR